MRFIPLTIFSIHKNGLHFIICSNNNNNNNNNNNFNHNHNHNNDNHNNNDEDDNDDDDNDNENEDETIAQKFYEQSSSLVFLIFI